MHVRAPDGAGCMRAGPGSSALSCVGARHARPRQGTHLSSNVPCFSVVAARDLTSTISWSSVLVLRRPSVFCTVSISSCATAKAAACSLAVSTTSLSVAREVMFWTCRVTFGVRGQRWAHAHVERGATEGGATDRHGAGEEGVGVGVPRTLHTRRRGQPNRCMHARSKLPSGNRLAKGLAKLRAMTAAERDMWAAGECHRIMAAGWCSKRARVHLARRLNQDVPVLCGDLGLDIRENRGAAEGEGQEVQHSFDHRGDRRRRRSTSIKQSCCGGRGYLYVSFGCPSTSSGKER